MRYIIGRKEVVFFEFLTTLKLKNFGGTEFQQKSWPNICPPNLFICQNLPHSRESTNVNKRLQSDG